VTYISIVRQRLGKHIPREPTRTTIGRLLLGNGSVNTHKIIRGNRRRCFPRASPLDYITESSEGAAVVGSGESSVEEAFIWVSYCREFRRVLEMAVQGDWEDMARNELDCKEDYVCDLKWQWDCYKSVVRIRLVKTENPSACTTVNCKVCTSVIALYCT
jgi:hypothetical protein